MGFKYCLFDLDGTLTDPAIGITNSVMHALEKYDIHVEDRSELYPFIGPPLDYSFKTFYGFSDEQAVQAIKYYREYFSVTGLFENSVYDGIPEMLRALKDKGLRLAIVSNKLQEGVDELYERYFRDTVEVAIGERPGVQRKPAPDMVRLALQELEVERKCVQGVADFMCYAGGKVHNGSRGPGAQLVLGACLLRRDVADVYDSLLVERDGLYFKRAVFGIRHRYLAL